MATNKFELARNVLLEAIRPALQTMGRGGLAAEQLVLGTGIQESLLTLRQQLNHGPALGLFQMEPETHDDWWENYLDFRDNLANKVKQTLAAGQKPAADTMKLNDCYAAAMCRVRYLRAPGALPAANDINAMANYWKQNYNTPQGKGSPEEFLSKWPQYISAHTFD